jgi:hypothetical protein
MFVDSITVWSDSNFKWQIVLPSVWSPVRGTPEESLDNGRLNALVVEGNDLRPLSGVPVSVESVAGVQGDFSRIFHSDTSGRLYVDGLDEAGPVDMVFTMNNYMESRVGPVHIVNGETGYALYALTPETDVIRIRNADNVPSGKSVWFPEYKRGIVFDRSGMTVFAYDPVTLSLHKTGFLYFPVSYTDILAATAIPAMSGRGMEGDKGYLLAIKSSPSVITFYNYMPSDSDAIREKASVTISGEVEDFALGYNRMVAVTSEGVFFYTLMDQEGDMDPVLNASLDMPARRVFLSGENVFVFTSDGRVATIDVHTWSMPVVIGSTSVGFNPRDGAVSSGYMIVADDDELLHVARISGPQLFNGESFAEGALNTLQFTGQVQMDMQDQTGIRTIVVGDRAYGYVLKESGVSVVELTDNAMLQIAFYPLPSTPRDILFVQRRPNDTLESAVLVLTDDGFYTLPAPEGSQPDVLVDIDMTALASERGSDWYVWTSNGFVKRLETDTVAGVERLYWRSELPSGVYDVAMVDGSGEVAFSFSSVSFFQDNTNDAMRIEASIDLQRTDGSRAGSFLPGQEIYVNMGVDVWQETVADAWLVISFIPDGSAQEMYCPALPAADGSFEVSYCQESMSGLPPFRRSWDLSTMSNMRRRLIRLPDGDYGGAGIVSLFFMPPGSDSGDEDAVYDRVDTPFSIMP